MSDGSSLIFGIVAWLLDILIAQMALLDQSKYISHDHASTPEMRLKEGACLDFETS